MQLSLSTLLDCSFTWVGYKEELIALKGVKSNVQTPYGNDRIFFTAQHGLIVLRFCRDDLGIVSVLNASAIGEIKIILSFSESLRVVRAHYGVLFEL